MSSDLLFKTWPCLSMALFAAGMVFRYSRSQKMVVGEKRFHMTKSIGQILGQTVAVAAMCFLYAGPAAANANPPAASVTGNDVPKHEERVSDAMPALSVRGARDRLADFFERTGGGARVIPASEVWESLDQGAMKYLVVDVRSAEDFAKGHVPGAVHMPLQTLFRQANLSRLNASRKMIVLVCSTGHMESMALGGLVALGFEPYALRFGMIGWRAESRVKAGSSGQQDDVVHGLGAPVEQ
ncbi:MAG: rhodanese-like domain-containing protein [Deltaproteobacteria bacterium]|nr:MAG: rhodanese-like domain-containing protein [Deltaproteobacteria bacterium]